MGATAPWFLEQFRALNGSMLSGGKLYFFVAGSTVLPKNIYADYALTTPLTQPLVLDGSGTAPEYFMEPGLYKIVLRDSTNTPAGDVMTGNLIATRDNVAGVGGGGSPSEDSYMVKVRSDDAAPGFLDAKLGASTTVSWEIVDVGGGVLQIIPHVDANAVRDWKVKADGAPGDTPGFVQAKITDKLGNTFTVNSTSGRRVVIPLQDYLSLVNGGHVEGPTTIDELTVVTFNMGPGASGMLIIGADGAVTRQPIPAETGRIRMDSDDVIGYAKVKIQPGAGMRIDYTDDPDLGEIMSISMINVPTPIMIPAKRIVLGSGTGVTSYVDLTYYNKQLIADAVSVETFYLGAGSYAGFSNKEVRAVPTRNFRDGVTQYADGTVRVGANGDYGAIKIAASTKIIDTANDTTLRIGGKMLDPGVEITLATYTLPAVAAGETQTIRFNGPAGCTITADAAQVPRYRSSSTGQSVVGTAGGQVDAAAIFGTAAGCKVASITIKGISATACQVIY